MFPYWLIFSVFAFGSLSRPYQVNRRLGPLLGVALVALTLFVGLRYRVGADWSGYKSIFKNAGLLDWVELTEHGDPGFYSLIGLLHSADLGLWSLNLACATIFMVGLCAFARRMPNPWLTISVALPYLIFVIAMSGIRQATAIGLFYLSINAYRDRRLLASVAWLILAATFHASAIVMLGVAGLSFSRNRLQSLLIIGVTGFFASYALSSSFDLYTLRYGQHQIQSSGTIYRILMNIIAAVPFLLLSKKFPVSGDHEMKFWRHMSWLSIACLPALAVVSSSTALDRFSLYLIPLQTYVLTWLPAILARNPRNYRTLTIILLVYLAMALLVFLNFGVNAQYSVPYRIYPVFGEHSSE